MLVMLAVTMFGSQFFTKKIATEKMGSGLFTVMWYNLCGGIVSFLIFVAMTGFRLEYTPFTLLMACLSVLNGKLFSYCSFKSFERVNLAVYSLLAMLGGMMLPLAAGLLFFDEILTWGILLCVVFIVAALVVSMKKDPSHRPESGTRDRWSVLFYIGVFCFNGFSGVISKVFTAADFPKASKEGYSALCSMIALAVSLVFVVALWKKRPKMSFIGTSCSCVSSVLNKFGNYFLLIALAVLPASVNYPMVTGGTIIVSTLLSYFKKDKPKLKNWIAVALAFAGILILTFVDIPVFS